MKPFACRTYRHPHGTGFSLIETVLALGIMSLAITALLGLLPHGIEMSRKAANASAQSRIIDQIQSRLSNNSFKSLDKLSDQTLHFDDQGEMLDDDKDLRTTVYVAKVVASSSAIRIPGGAKVETTLKRFIVKIVATPKTDFDFDGAPINSYQSVPVLIAPTIP